MSIKSIATVVQTEGTTIDAAVQSDGVRLDIAIYLHELAGVANVCSPDAVEFAKLDLAKSIDGIAERAFVNGDGLDQPHGFMAYPDEIEHFEGVLEHDPIVSLIYNLAPEYRRSAMFVMNNKAAGAVRKLKDGDGRLMWTDAPTIDQRSRLLGLPVVVHDDMPDNRIAFGDFKQGYMIGEWSGVNFLQEPFLDGSALIQGTKRVGGAVVLPKAIKTFG